MSFPELPPKSGHAWRNGGDATPPLARKDKPLPSIPDEKPQSRSSIYANKSIVRKKDKPPPPPRGPPPPKPRSLPIDESSPGTGSPREDDPEMTYSELNEATMMKTIPQHVTRKQDNRADDVSLADKAECGDSVTGGDDDGDGDVAQLSVAEQLALHMEAYRPAWKSPDEISVTSSGYGSIAGSTRSAPPAAEDDTQYESTVAVNKDIKSKKRSRIKRTTSAPQFPEKVYQPPPPVQPVKDPTKTGVYPWFFEETTSVEAERLLHYAEDGTFLIRPSSHTMYPYTLSMQQQGTVHHIHIGVRDRCYALVSESNKKAEKWFSSLLELVTHYSSQMVTPKHGGGGGMRTMLRGFPNKSASAPQQEYYEAHEIRPKPTT